MYASPFLIVFILYIIIITAIVWKIDGTKSGILILVIFLGIFSFLFVIPWANDTYYSGRAFDRMNEDIDYLESRVKNNRSYKDKYQVETYKLVDGRILVRLFNERDEYVDADCFLKFYDNGKEVDIPNFTYISDIAPHSYGYGLVYDYPSSNDSYKKYQSDEIKVFLSPRNNSDRVFCEKNIQYAYNQEEGIIYGVNKFDGNITEINFGVLQYDENGRIVDYDSRRLYDKILPNGEFNIKNYNNDGKIEVVLESAVCEK